MIDLHSRLGTSPACFALAWTLSALLGITAQPVVAGEAEGASIAVLPDSFTLSGSESLQRVLVVETTAAAADGSAAALSGPLVTGRLALESTDEGVVVVRGEVVHPVGNGSAEIVARDQTGREARATVVVENVETEHRWSFRNDVQSILSRSGCNTGGCHGALAGKGGFRLSLSGYDSETDHRRITRETQGRRVELADPGRSLVLAKPTGALPHKGGLRLDAESRDYRVLSEWIAAGAPGPRQDDPQLQRISVLPEESLLQPEDQARIVVMGHYDDGRVVDVTHWARFSATDEAVASVDADGRVTVQGSGQGAVLAWFGSQVALARLTVPYPFDVPESVYAAAPRRNFIDDLVLEQLQTLRLRPSPRGDDSEFIRRATLDTIGRLPTVEEVREFLADDRPERRDALIDRLLARDDFVDYWAYHWSDLLLVNGARLRPAAVKAYYQWIHDRVRENTPWDELVRQVITATGDSTVNGATNFYALHQDPENMTENVSQAFLGLSIACAQCHNHPLEKWTNDQYYGMANLFARVRAKGWGGEPRSGDGLRSLYVATQGDLVQPSRGRPQPPTPLDGTPLPFDDPSDRREALADWMVAPENPYFARAITNRVWANFFGRGLVESVDDMRLSNPASNEPLLAAAAQFTIDKGFDLKQLMREILRSETYQRSSVPLEENAAEMKYLSRAYPRRMMAEVMLDAIDQVLETTTVFDSIGFPGADRQETDFYPVGTRAIQLYDSAVESYFLKTFGRNPREITCECERSDEPSMVQVLHLSNGETLNPKLAEPGNRIGRLLESGASDEAIIEEVFLAALARRPLTEEIETLLQTMAEYEPAERRTALEDLFWSVLSSAEFAFNQ